MQTNARVVQHGDWMLRGYATGMVTSAVVDPPTELSRALLMGAGWVINLAVAEWIIRRRPARPARAAAVGSGASGA
jgi:hypothetical protein